MEEQLMSVDQLTQARTLLEHLTFQEKLYLLNDLTRQLLQQAVEPGPESSSHPLPTIHLATWPQELPLRREELYDDRGR
jgi:hypothetical protein